jgi:DNA modification methylase
LKDLDLIQASAVKLPLPDESVQCIVTSPPYWGLRKYSGEQESIWGGKRRCAHEWGAKQISAANDSNRGSMEWKTGGDPGAKILGEKVSQGCTCTRCGAWRGAFGLEPTIEMYIAHTVTILRELRRVLRPDGVLFWNIGDSYAGGGNYRGITSYESLSDKQRSNRGATGTNQELGATRDRLTGSLKPKDLCLIPARVAIAAQSDGWWVRSMIVWAKPNPMPESVTDRPTDAYEYIIMLTRSERYYWDADAVREPSTSEHTAARAVDDGAYQPGRDARDGKERFCSGTGGYVPPGGRNLRNVWNFATQPYSGAHFATFPEELPRRCILAATSARGACLQCGAPWERVTRSATTSGKSWNGDDLKSQGINRGENQDYSGARFYENYTAAQTIGWRPTCLCRGQRGKVGPCVVLDPFGGSGTTGRVALELRRRAILCDVAYGPDDEYRRLAVERTRNVQVEFF